MNMGGNVVAKSIGGTWRSHIPIRVLHTIFTFYMQLVVAVICFNWYNVYGAVCLLLDSKNEYKITKIQKHVILIFIRLLY